jgi:tetratricopeptide (TPR) repeat protein
MMQALISGQAARVVFVQGAEINFIDAESPDEFHPIGRHEIRHVLGFAEDVEVINVAEPQDAFARLLEKYNLNRAIVLLDIAIDSDYEDDIRISAAHEFVEIIKDDSSYFSVNNHVYSFYNEKINIEQKDGIFKDNIRFIDYINNLHVLQIHIVALNNALQMSFERNNIDQLGRKIFLSAAVSRGIFRNLVEARGDGSRVNDATLSGYMALKDVVDARLIIQEWTREFIEKRTRKSLKQLEREFEELESESYNSGKLIDGSRHEIFKGIKAQQAAIIGRLESHDISSARRFAVQLVEYQLRNGGPSYAAKSLSLLATEARRRGQHSVELEWARDATELAPDDGVAHGLLADTYLQMLRLEEAKRAFEKSIAFGEIVFGRAGLARTLKVSGSLDEALKAFKTLSEEVPDEHEEANYVWAGYAGVLRDMWRFNEALDVADAALERLPESPSLHCLKASVLADLGRLEEAAAWFKASADRFPDEPVPYCGYASVLAKAGKLEEALAAYRSAKDQFPNISTPVIGYAGVLRSKGRADEALELLAEASSRFPHELGPYCGLAETYRDMGDLDAAVRAYDDAIAKFDLDVVARNGRANILKLSGRYEDALQAYDENVRDFPYDIVGRSGRADLLKRLGSYAEAAEAYGKIQEIQPNYVAAAYSMAAVWAAMGRYEDALQLLPEGLPEREEEWIAYHVRGMIYLGLQNIEKAIEIFEYGLSNGPFYRQKAYFRSGLASARMQQRDFEGAADILRGSKEPFERLMLIHALAEVGRTEEAAVRYKAMNDNLPGLAGELRMELGARYRFVDAPPLHDDQWMLDSEAEVILQLTSDFSGRHLMAA